MRRIVFIILAVVAAAIVGFFCWRAFLIPGINFVTDYTQILSGNHFKVQRLYAAEVDLDAFNQAVEEMMNATEYTEEEILAAAIASGKPEFFPSFNFGIYRDGDEILLDGFVDIGLAEGQTDQRFKMENISLEVLITQGDLTIKDVDVIHLTENSDDSVVKVNSEQQALADISNAKAFRIKFDGENGSVTLRLIYNIEAGTLLPKTALEEQYLEIHAMITTGSAMNIEVEYVVEPYSSLEEINEG
ncbi:MAG: hypothetical protein FWG33_02565 [Oscillospiraceae bacterium]|nr:hypothetical protein [Oscillospiraceae bacterium]